MPLWIQTDPLPEFLIYDDDELVVGVVVLIEKASANQCHADGFEVIAVRLLF
jgi:hypothetical protein